MAQYDLQLFGSELIIDDPYTLAFQEIDILFGTECTEVLGDPDYGVNFEQFLWKMSPEPTKVREYILERINKHTNFARKMIKDVQVKVEQGTVRDIYMVDIEFNNSQNDGKSKKNKTYVLR